MRSNNSRKPRSSARPTINLDQVVETPVDTDMLFEATEALVRAITLQNAQTEHEAVRGAMASETMAPFDGRDAMEAERFLRRMGYLSVEA